MKEQLYTLLDQTLTECVPSVYFGPDQIETIKKLVEIVIIECCKIADENLDDPWPGGEIAKHFGIEYEG